MNADPRILKGVNAAVLTPLNRDMSPDIGRMTAHCQWLLANGSDGLGILGTTGEAQSFTVRERMDILEGLGKAGIPLAKTMPGTGAANYVDAAELTKHSVDIGAGGALLLPPYYIKGVGDDGLFVSFDKIINHVASNDLRVYLYHFPQMSGIPFSHDLIDRLVQAFPGIVVGVKDSSGDEQNMLEMLKKFPGFNVFPGSESAFLNVLKAGGAGCITAVSNVAMAAAQRVYSAWTNEQRVDQGAEAIIQALRTVIAGYPLSSALKALMARHHGDEGWDGVRPPLVSLSEQQRNELFAAIDTIDYAIPAV